MSKENVFGKMMKQPETKQPSREQAVEGLVEALREMVANGCPEYGEHEIHRCVYCGKEGYNRVAGDRYSVKHNAVCSLANGEQALAQYEAKQRM